MFQLSDLDKLDGSTQGRISEKNYYKALREQREEEAASATPAQKEERRKHLLSLTDLGQQTLKNQDSEN